MDLFDLVPEDCAFDADDDGGGYDGLEYGFQDLEVVYTICAVWSEQQTSALVKINIDTDFSSV